MKKTNNIKISLTFNISTLFEELEILQSTLKEFNLKIKEIHFWGRFKKYYIYITMRENIEKIISIC